MTPTVASAAQNAGSSNFTVSVPSGTVNGDLLIAVNASDFSTLAASPVPAGFTALATSSYDGGSNSIHVAIGYRIASSEPANYTFTVGSSSDNAAALLRITGHDSTPTIVQVAPTAFSAAAAVIAPTITPNGATDLLVCFASSDGANGTGTVSWTPPSGMTEHADAQSATFTSVTAASLQNPSSPSGTKTFTSSPGNDHGGACTISIKSATAGGAAFVPIYTMSPYGSFH